jgi:hypothetical protein
METKRLVQVLEENPNLVIQLSGFGALSDSMEIQYYLDQLKVQLMSNGINPERIVTVVKPPSPWADQVIIPAILRNDFKEEKD